MTNTKTVSSNVTHIKDKDDFLKAESTKVFDEMIFWHIVGNKAHIKISAPIYVKEVKQLLKYIKD